MFTGIIESLGIVKKIIPEGENLHITIESNFRDSSRLEPYQEFLPFEELDLDKLGEERYNFTSLYRANPYANE